MPVDVHGHIEVACRTTVGPRRALGLQPNSLPVAHAGGDAHVHSGATGAPARAVTHRTWIIDEQAATSTVCTRLAHRATAAVGRAVPGAGTPQASPPHRSRPPH